MEAKEYRGLWWLPSNKERKVAGVLTYIPSEEFKLELIGTFDAEYDGTFLAGLKSNLVEPVIHGQSSDGSDITLFECVSSFSHTGCAEFSTSIYKARAIAVGLHLESIDEKRFFRSSVRIPELSYWFYPAIIKHEYDDQHGRGIMVKIDNLSDDEREVARVDLSKNLSVCLCRDASFESGNMYFNPSFEQFTSLKIESRENLSLKEYYEIVARYEQFLSLATFREVGYSELRLFSKDNYYEHVEGETYYEPIIVDTKFHTKPSTKKIERHKFIFDYKSIEEQYPRALQKWFSNDRKFDAIRTHFLDSIDYHGHFSYINFLVVIQAVEGYGQRFIKKTKRRSLQEILTDIFRALDGVVCVNQDVDLGAIVATRHYHSHLLAKRSDKALDGINLYELTDELRKVLICCILSYIGFTKDQINDITKHTNNDLFG